MALDLGRDLLMPPIQQSIRLKKDLRMLVMDMVVMDMVMGMASVVIVMVTVMDMVMVMGLVMVDMVMVGMGMVDIITEKDLLRISLNIRSIRDQLMLVMDMDMDTVMVLAMVGMDMATVMATVDIIMERDLLKVLRYQWFMLYLKDLPMLDMATEMAMDMAMDMVDIVTVMVTMVVHMAMDTMEVIISPAFILYVFYLYCLSLGK